MNKNLIFGAFALVLLALVWWKFGPDPISDFTIPMAEGEAVSSWNYQGTYTGNVEFEARAHAEIERLEKLFGSKEFTDYVLYVSIANQYGLLGNGEKELEYLQKALAFDSENTGLAWYNAGILFERFGANKTARYAFEHAVAAQPIGQYRLALVEFLKRHYPGDAAIAEQEDAAGSSDGEISY